MNSARQRRFRALLAVVALAGCDDATVARETSPGEAVASAELDIREERDGLWSTDSAGMRRRLTALRVASFDYDSLAAKQREGEVILYWAAAPAPSPDGRRVAYATNREAVAADTSGQSIWLLERGTGAERALLHVAGHSYRPTAWLDGDVVYIGDEPGVWTVDPETGERRELSRGAFVAAARNGGAVLVAEDLPDAPRLEVITATRHLPVPPAPAGFVYLPQGSFDAGGTRVALEASADSGRTRSRFDLDVESGVLRPAQRP